MIGYEFNVEKWLHAKRELDMQMHYVPQEVILSILYVENCELLEVQKDVSTGSNNTFVSHLFCRA
jgi:hypothetical protein